MADRPKIVLLPPNYWETKLSPQPTTDEMDPTPLHRHLAELGCECLTINPNRFPWNPFARKNPFLRGLDPIRALAVLWTCRDATAVISVFESSGLFILLWRWLFRFRPKVLLWDASMGNSWRVVIAIQRITLPRYDAFLMLTTSQKAAIERLKNVKSPVHLLYYSVDDSFFHPQHNREETTILTVGDDISRDYKTFWTAIHNKAVPVVMKTRWRPVPDAAVTDSPRHVTYVSERLKSRQFRDLYSTAMIVVIPLFRVDHAGGITGLFEAMAMGKAIVLSESSLSDDFVTHEVEALVVPTGDAQAMSRAIDRLLADGELRQRLGRNARRKIDEEFSTRALAERLLMFATSQSAPPPGSGSA